MTLTAPAFEVIEGGSLMSNILTNKEPIKEPLRNQDFWLRADELATLAGATERAVQSALKARHWRGGGVTDAPGRACM